MFCGINGIRLECPKFLRRTLYMLEAIKDQNPWWTDPSWTFEGVERNVFKFVGANKDDISVLLIKGPVCSGKTFLLKQFVHYLIKQNTRPESILYFNLNEKAAVELLNKGYQFVSFLKDKTKNTEGKVYLLFDEIQELPDDDVIQMLASHIRFKIIMVSSYQSDIVKKISQSLLGRTTTFYMFPFSFREYLFTKTKNPDILQKLHSLEALMRFLIIDPEDTFPQLKEFYSRNQAVFDFIEKHFLEYAVYGGYPQVIFRKAGSNVFDSVFNIIKKCLESVPKSGNRIQPDIQLYVGILERIAKEELSEPDYDAGELQSGLTNAHLIMPIRAFNPDREMRSLMPVRFVLTDHGMRNVLCGYKAIQEPVGQTIELLKNLMVTQLSKFLYFDEMKSKDLYYLFNAGHSYYRYVFCDALDNVYPIGFVPDEDLKKNIKQTESEFPYGILFTTGEFKILASRKKRVFLLPYLFLAGI